MWFSKFQRDERGNVMILAAAAMPVIIGSAGIAIDTMQLSLAKRDLQREADSAALAAAYAKAQEKSATDAVARIVREYSQNVLTAAPVVTEPTSGQYPGRSVRVQLSSTKKVPFMAFFVKTPPTLHADATAALVYTGQYCMVALDRRDVTGITFTGNTTMDLGCGVVSNARGKSSVYADGSARVIASPVAAVGGVPDSTAYVKPTILIPHSLPQADPYKNVPDPSPSNCSSQKLNVQPNTEVNLSPGCWRGGDIKGTVNLAPGTYYFSSAELNIGATANVIGTGVTIVLTSSTPSTASSFATVDIHGNANMKLTAPSSGPFAGLVFYQDRRAGDGSSNFINGNSSSKYEGSFYFPSQEVTFNGNTGMQTECVQIVANRIRFTGNSRVTNKCDTAGGARAFDASWVRLVA